MNTETFYDFPRDVFGSEVISIEKKGDIIYFYGVDNRTQNKEQDVLKYLGIEAKGINRIEITKRKIETRNIFKRLFQRYEDIIRIYVR
jgi:hypothetical protein